MDEVEKEYIRAINRAGDTDEAYDLSVGLKQYKDLYKDWVIEESISGQD